MADIGGDVAIAPRVASRLELAKQLHRRPAARIPACEEILLIGIEHTAPIRTAMLRHRPRWQAQIPLDGVPAATDLRGNGWDRPALAVQGPHRIIGGLAVGRALGRLLLGERGSGWGWHRDRHRPIGERHRLLAHHRIGRTEGVVMRGEDLVQTCCQILEQMKTVCHLERLGRALTSALGIDARPIPRNHLHSWVLLEPLAYRLGRTIREQRHGLATLQINQYCTIGLTFAQRPVIHPQHPGRGQNGQRQPAQPAQQRIPAHREAPLMAQTHPSLTTERHAQRDQAVGEPQCAPRPGSGHRRLPFGENVPHAVGIVAKTLWDAQLKAHAVVRPGQIGQGPCIVAVETTRRDGAEWTGYAGLRRAHAQGDLYCGVIDGTGVEVYHGGIG
jgi:hypothetical protein